jgi:hypothetical protein
MKESLKYAFNKIIRGQKISKKDSRTLKKKFSQIDLLVIKHSSDKLGMSKPCAHCTDIIKKIGIRSIYYSNAQGDIINVRVRDLSSEHLTQSAKLGFGGSV